MAVYGIDLGTTFCSVAYVHEGRVQLVPLERGLPVFASVVAVDGRTAMPRAAAGLRAETEYERWIGESDVAPENVALVRGAKNYMALHVAGRDPERPPWRVGKAELWSTDVAAVILRSLRDLIQQRPGLPPIDGVVVTHPQRFRNRERVATQQAAELAGLRLLRMITEPDAAAWAYGLYEAKDSSKRFMVFDFGGGTLDVTVMERGEDGKTLRVLGSYGTQLGGLELDRKIRDRLLEKFASKKEEYKPLRTEGLGKLNEKFRQRLLKLAERCKIALNRDAPTLRDPMTASWATTLEVENENEVYGPERIEVNLRELSGWIAVELDRATECAVEALRRVGIGWDRVDSVLMTGGSSLLYPMQQRLRAVCNRVLVRSEDPDDPLSPSTIVAAGAALLGATLEKGDGQPAAVRGALPDGFALQAWIAAKNAIGYQTLIAAGTPTPTKTSTPFTVRYPVQVLPVDVYEGEGDGISKVGEYHFDFGRELPAGTRVDVQFEVASNGSLSLRVYEPGGSFREARLDAEGVYSEEELRKRKDWVQGLNLLLEV